MMVAARKPSVTARNGRGFCLYNWSYEQTERFVNDSIVVRQFYRTVPAENAPDGPTPIRWANHIGAQDTRITLQAGAMGLGRSLKVTRERKMFVDSTVVETNVHHPSDSALLGDGMKVLQVILHPSEVLPHGPQC